MRRFFSLLLALTLVLLGTVPALAGEVAAVGLPDAAYQKTSLTAGEDPELLATTVTVNVTGQDNQAEARKLLDMVNAARSAVGRSSLAWNTDLEATAMQRAAEIAAYYSHTRPNGEECFSVFPPYDWSSHVSARGENIATGQYDAIEVNNDWTNSEGHYRNMINENFHSMAAASFSYTCKDGYPHLAWVEVFSSNQGTGMTGAAATGQHTYSITLAQDKISPSISVEQNLNVGDTGTARLWQTSDMNYPCYCVELKSDSLVWSSSNPSALSIDSGGAYQALTAGEAEVSATLSSTYTYSASVTVSDGSLDNPDSSRPYMVNLVQPEHGTSSFINGTPPYYPGKAVNVLITPNEGYAIERVSAEEVKSLTTVEYPAPNTWTGGSWLVTFEMPANNVTLSATITKVALAEHAITIEGSENGTVALSHTTAAAGTEVALTLTPNDGYVVNDVAVTNSSGTPVSLGGTYTHCTFFMPDSDVRVRVDFKRPQDLDTRFPDVRESDWFYDKVEWVAEKGIMNGDGDGTYFNPTGNLSRAAMAQLLYNANGKPAADASVVERFPDCLSSEWYAKAVSWACTTGAITGYDSGNFGPGDPVTREQFATILWRLEGKPAGTGNLSAFPDERSVSAFSRDALKWAVGEGVITGDGGKLSPGKAITRAEAATMLMRWME